MVVTSVTGRAANHCHTDFIAYSVTIKAPTVTDTDPKLSPTDTNIFLHAVIMCRLNSCRHTHSDPHTPIDL